MMPLTAAAYMEEVARMRRDLLHACVAAGTEFGAAEERARARAKTTAQSFVDALRLEVQLTRLGGLTAAFRLMGNAAVQAHASLVSLAAALDADRWARFDRLYGPWIAAAVLLVMLGAAGLYAWLGGG